LDLDAAPPSYQNQRPRARVSLRAPLPSPPGRSKTAAARRKTRPGPTCIRTYTRVRPCCSNAA